MTKTMVTRYDACFERLRQAGQGAFIPFTVLGDPDREASLGIIRTLVTAGADALELGLPFSDPVADGPTIQAADVRALAAGMRQADGFALVRAIREEFPALPIGLLVYANLVLARGLDEFYRRAHASGVDSVLVADVPTLEAQPFVAAACAAHVAPVMIAPSTASERTLQQVAALSAGYTYVVTRRGVTGADSDACVEHAALLASLQRFGAPPAVLGFGISTPDHVRRAIQSGAAGVISGSAVVALIAKHLAAPAELHARLAAFVRGMKAATARAGEQDGDA